MMNTAPKHPRSRTGRSGLLGLSLLDEPVVLVGGSVGAEVIPATDSLGDGFTVGDAVVVTTGVGVMTGLGVTTGRGVPRKRFSLTAPAWVIQVLVSKPQPAYDAVTAT